jgi:threonyl-tRNA synthetase
LASINITWSNGRTQTVESGTTIAQLLKDEPSLRKSALAAEVNGKGVDLAAALSQDATIQILTAEDEGGREVFWHSSSHVMAQAVKRLFPNVHLGIGPAVENGFYYDFELAEPISAEDFERIEAEMRKIVESDQPFVQKTLSKPEAAAFFEKRNEPFKVEIIRDIEAETVTVYENGDFADLCRGPHVPSTGRIKHFKLLAVAGAYWHGDERNPVMQRLYGVSFPDAKSLEAHLTRLEEAKKRDHRRLGKELDLFSFQPEGPGFPFWHPAGTILFNQVSNYIRETLALRGYQEIRTPIILNEDLWHRSGHWDHYKENMYFTTIDEQNYAVKPMNCPGGLLVFKNEPHSYRDLPIKLSELGLVHRHEKSGVLHGLFRVRQFTQDDAHVFCTVEQMEDEIIALIDLIAEVYHVFGFDQIKLELSTRPANSIGTDDMWAKAESALANALAHRGISYQMNPGEGAFYGPKIDYHIEDSLGRLWQCGTIQVDFSMPERFELEYIGQDGGKHRPVMIHRAIFGSIERFIGILIEHVGGAFPLWLAPVQCVLIPISERFRPDASAVCRQLQEKGIRAKLDDRNEKVGYKIRDAETRKIPYMGIIGEREAASKTVSIRKRKDGDLGPKPVAEWIAQLQEEIARRVNY